MYLPHRIERHNPVFSPLHCIRTQRNVLHIFVYLYMCAYIIYICTYPIESRDIIRYSACSTMCEPSITFLESRLSFMPYSSTFPAHSSQNFFFSKKKVFILRVLCESIMQSRLSFMLYNFVHMCIYIYLNVVYRYSACSILWKNYLYINLHICCVWYRLILWLGTKSSFFTTHANPHFSCLHTKMDPPTVREISC